MTCWTLGFYFIGSLSLVGGKLVTLLSSRTYFLSFIILLRFCLYFSRSSKLSSDYFLSIQEQLLALVTFFLGKFLPRFEIFPGMAIVSINWPTFFYISSKLINPNSTNLDWIILWFSNYLTVGLWLGFYVSINLIILYNSSVYFEGIF